MSDAQGGATGQKSIGPRAAAVAVAAAGFGLMAVEVAAGRVISPLLGNSLYSWTTIIGVILSGMVMGNMLGGAAARRGADRRMVGILLATAAFATVISFYTIEPLYRLFSRIDMALPVEILLFSAIAFFPMSVLTSAVTPMAMTLRLDDLKKTGRVVGSLSAVSAASNIAGVFLAGYALIPFFGARNLLLVVAAVLMLAAIILAGGPKLLIAGSTGYIFVTMLWLGLLAPMHCFKESAYYCITILEQDGGQALQLDYLHHSFVFDDPMRLDYAYEAVYAVATEYVSKAADGKPLDVLFLGGGGYVMPRFLQEAYLDPKLTVVEIDPEVTRTAITQLGLDPFGPIVSHNEDARTFLMRAEPGTKYDIVFGDAFNGYSVPFHLVTKEFAEMIQARLSSRGIYALNIIDESSTRVFLSSIVETLRSAFPHVEIAPLSHAMNLHGRVTYVILASNEPIDAEAWHEAGDMAFDDIISQTTIDRANATYLMSEGEKERTMLVPHHMFTDDFVPVDNILAPVFKNSL